MKKLRKPGSISVPTPEGVIDIMVRFVKSSNVEWVGWPATGEPLLIVQFKSGDRYGYSPVTRQKAVAMANAASPGGYLNAKIKPRYKAVKIR